MKGRLCIEGVTDSWDIFGTLSGWYGTLMIHDGMNYPSVKTAKFKDDRIA
jgi:hypothetical protein